jgi:hypothetical protein
MAGGLVGRGDMCRHMSALPDCRHPTPIARNLPRQTREIPHDGQAEWSSLAQHRENAPTGWGLLVVLLHDIGIP